MKPLTVGAIREHVAKAKALAAACEWCHRPGCARFLATVIYGRRAWIETVADCYQAALRAA